MTSLDERSQNHAELVEKYFDEHAQSWHDYYLGSKSLTHIILKERMQLSLAFLNAYLPPEQGKKVLDAGCGSGLIGVAMVKQGYKVEGWDISEKMIAISQQNFQEAKLPTEQYSLSAGNLFEGNLDDEAYDGIMALGFLQYQPNETDVLRFFNRVLSPGGILILSGPVGVNLSNYFGLAQKFKNARRQRRKGVAPQSAAKEMREQLHTISANDYSLGRFRSLLEKSDLEMVAYRGHGYAHFEFLAKKLANRHQKRLHRTLTKISKFIPIQRYANDMIVVARK